MADEKKTTIKVLIIDTSVISRDFLRKALEDIPDIQVVAVAPNGQIGMQKVKQSKPDIILYDMNINDISSIEFTIESLKHLDNPGIILTAGMPISTDTVENIILTLEKGAFDFIEKPDDSIAEEMAIATLKRKLHPKILAFSIKRYSGIAIRASGISADKQKSVTANKKIDEKKDFLQSRQVQNFSIVVIGVSTGGPEVLTKIIPQLPANFPLPIVIVLHMPKLFTSSMAAELDRKSKLQVKESEPGDVLKPRTVFLAQGGIHLVVRKNKEGKYLLDVDDGPPENGCKPSVDVLFHSISEYYSKDVLALILTGMGQDGVKGLGELRSKGARTLVQDEETSLIWGMPGTAVKSGFADEVLPVDSIAQRILEITGAV